MNTPRFLFALLLASGCGTAVKTTVINPSPRPMQPRPPASVEVFTSGAPDRPRADVAMIEVEEQSSLSTSDTAEMLQALRVRGAQMGCDAVVVGGASSRDPGVRDAESWVSENPKGRKGFYGTCIVYLPEPPPAPPAAPLATGS
jgi:hypothetical protein